MKPLRSILWRILAWFGLLLVLILGGLGFSVFQYERNQQTRGIDVALQERTTLLSRIMKPIPRNRGGERPPPGGPPGPSDPVREDDVRFALENSPFFHGATGYYYVIWRNGFVLAASPDAPDNIPFPENREELLRTRGQLREAYFAPSPDVCVLAGTSMDNYRDGMKRFGLFLIAAGVIVLSISLIGGWWLITLALRPIQSITEAAAKIATGDLTQRIDALETESELGELAALLNETFSRLDAAFAQQARFTADAAHELRTPISVILTHAQNGLVIPENTEEQNESFAACQRAAQRMRKLIDSLLELTRFTSGREAIHYLPFNLATVAEESAEMVQALAETRGMEIETELDSAGMRGDSDRINQVLTNLLTNAIHYGRESGKIRVVTWRNDTRSFCTVSDNGPGIEAKHLPHLFDRFYRVDKARTAAAGRTGLGLAICQAIVETHGGTIEVKSTPGEGTSFTIGFPVG